MVSFFLAGSWEKDTIFSAARNNFGPSYFVTAFIFIFTQQRKNFLTELILACISMMIFLSRRHCLLSWPSGCSHLITASPNADVIFISWRISFVLWLISEDCCKLKRRKYQTSKISLDKEIMLAFKSLCQLSWKKYANNIF